ncbi:hypothetical protein GCM10012284_13970 [Mangrovihabitans endophyticus]|uniref:Sensor-like histidine kinase SenX3 n=1 Tax=Mangrovihabitans endophyticus TaxID=1751298 RepID=A0A8J3BVW6_9ACTN|nr:hypothetical protein GCM10012284_13970 [Mangrovihabitans endophyticus]
MLIGLTGTALAAGAFRMAGDARTAQAMNQRTELVVRAITAEIGRYRTVLADLAAAVGAQSDLTAAEFTAITRPVDRQRLPGATGVVYVVPATTDQVPRLQAYWRARGNTALRLRPAAGREDHYFGVLRRTLDGRPVDGGTDIAQAPEAAEALRTARTSTQAAISSSYRLLRDAGLPPQRQQLSAVLAAPVIASSPPARVGAFRGWILMGLRNQDFLRQTIGREAGDQVRVALYDTPSGLRAPVARWDPGIRVDPGRAARDVGVVVVQRTWDLTVRPTLRLVRDTNGHADDAAWAVGGLITGLLVLLTVVVVTSRDRAVRRVAEATAALRTDIARREEVESRLRSREKELMGFAGMVAHDLRSPLAHVSAYAELLREEAAEQWAQTHRGFLDRLRAAAARMQELIDDLLTYATADSSTLRTADVDLGDLMAGIRADQMAADDPPHIEVAELPVVTGDPTLLRQVLENLIGNAVKYSPPGRRAEVRVRATAERPGWHRIEVADRGIGIPEDQRVEVFDAFTRARGSEGYPGTGLGLAIVQRVVDRHGGVAGVEPNPGGGSLFWFTLASGAAATPADSDTMASLSGSRA